jgi:hypothetical protein
MEENFKCKICNKKFLNNIGLGTHISINHGIKKYYDSFLKKENEEYCKICGKITYFISGTKGYAKTCCKEHEFKYKGKNLENALMKQYGVKSSMNVEKFKNQQRNTCLERYGVNSFLEIEKIHKLGIEKSHSKKANKKRIKTCIKKFGFDNCSKNLNIYNKIENTMVKNYGVKSFLSIQEEKEKSMMKKYGVRNPQQNKEIHQKQQISAFKCKKYKNTNIYYRGSFELDFLEKYHNKYPDLINGPSIKYKHKSKNKIYHSDFYIPSLNLVIECKNSYLFKRDYNIIKAKEKAVIDNGFKYFIIIDKNYANFL